MLITLHGKGNADERNMWNKFVDTLQLFTGYFKPKHCGIGILHNECEKCPISHIYKFFRAVAGTSATIEYNSPVPDPALARRQRESISRHSRSEAAYCFWLKLMGYNDVYGWMWRKLLPEWYRLSFRVSRRLPLRIALVAGLTPLASLDCPSPTSTCKTTLSHAERNGKKYIQLKN